uniref:Restriction endonuclease n=1 Tax=Rhabditophanes sp. KR3021 TaxID=114890 RepID=A0AC35TX93_9BILA
MNLKKASKYAFDYTLDKVGSEKLIAKLVDALKIEIKMYGNNEYIEKACYFNPITAFTPIFEESRWLKIETQLKVEVESAAKITHPTALTTSTRIFPKSVTLLKVSPFDLWVSEIDDKQDNAELPIQLKSLSKKYLTGASTSVFLNQFLVSLDN